MDKEKICDHCGGPLLANHLWCPGNHHEWGTMSDMWHDFLAGDWFAFWTGGPVRNAIYQPMKRFIQRADRWFETLE